MKWSPGPWMVAEDLPPFVYALNTSGTNRFSLSVSRGMAFGSERTSQSEIDANARLISAAPDLYDALSSARAYVQSFANFNEDKRAADVLADVDAALRKATGDAS